MLVVSVQGQFALNNFLHEVTCQWYKVQTNKKLKSHTKPEDRFVIILNIREQIKTNRTSMCIKTIQNHIYREYEGYINTNLTSTEQPV